MPRIQTLKVTGFEEWNGGWPPIGKVSSASDEGLLSYALGINAKNSNVIHHLRDERVGMVAVAAPYSSASIWEVLMINRAHF